MFSVRLRLLNPVHHTHSGFANIHFYTQDVKQIHPDRGMVLAIKPLFFGVWATATSSTHHQKKSPHSTPLSSLPASLTTLSHYRLFYRETPLYITHTTSVIITKSSNTIQYNNKKKLIYLSTIFPLNPQN